MHCFFDLYPSIYIVLSFSLAIAALILYAKKDRRHAHPQNGASVHVLRDKFQMTELAQIGQTAHQGARIIFCCGQAKGLPAIHGKGWAPLSSVSRA